jgi:hypothetical protein
MSTRTPHRVRTLVRLTEDQHDWLVKVGEALRDEWVSEYGETEPPAPPNPYVRHDGEINISRVVREMLQRASDFIEFTECPSIFVAGETPEGIRRPASVPFPADD